MNTDRIMCIHNYRQTDRQTQTDRDRHRQTETDRDRQRQTETDRDRQRQTEQHADIHTHLELCWAACRHATVYS